MIRLTLLVFCAAALAAAQTKNPLTDAVMARYNSIKQNLLDTAEVVPEELYAYRLTPAQRTLGEWLGHTAMGNYSYCSLIKGEKAPDTKHLHSYNGKGELSKALRESFDYCDAALQGMTDQRALTQVSAGGRQGYPVQGMINLVVSANEHYGNLVGYMRSKGIVPPSTARAMKKK